MSAPDSTVIQLNFKTPAGGLFNIYATNVPEAKELLAAFREELIQEIHDTEAVISAAVNVARTPAPTQPVTPQNTPSAATPPASDGDAPLCEHGIPAKLVPAGISKASGKPYRAFYACSQPRATQCNFKATV